MATGLPTSIVVEVEFTAGVWTDISTHVVGDSIEISVGKDSPAGDLQPGTLDLELDNADGTWTPDNPLSAYYPNVVEGKRIRVVVNKGTPSGYSTGAYGTGAYSGTLTESPRFVGRVTMWEPDFPTDPRQSRTRVTAVDVLGDLARKTLPPTLLPTLLAERITTGEPAGTQDYWYWPLRGGYRLVDAITGRGSLSYFQPSTGGEVSWGADSSFPLGGEDCLSVTVGVGLQFRWSLMGPFATSFGGAFKVETGTAGLVAALLNKKPTAADVGGLVIWWDGDAALSLREYVAGTPTTLATIAASPGWHYVDTDFGTLRVDDSSAGATPATYVSPTSLPTATLYVGGSLNLSVRDLFLSGGADYADYLANVTTTLTAITTGAATTLGVTDLDASLTWTTTVVGVTATAVAVEDRVALDVVGDLANSQSGIAYVAYTLTDPQPITLVANVDAKSTTVALTIDAENDLYGGPTLDRNVYDKVATASGRNAFTAVTVNDSTLVDTYGTSTGEVRTALALDNDLAAAATSLIAGAKSSKLRLSQVTFDLSSASNDLYSNWFGLAPGERVRVSNLPSTYFGVTQMDGHVIGWTERPGVDGYFVTLTLQPADAPTESKYDSDLSRYGWADGAATVTSGTAVGTTATGTLVITTPSGPCLSVAAGSYPLNLDWNGECVTITSAPASSTSPQTVTITARGVNGTVARSHAASEAVDIWQPARFAL